MPDCEGRSAEAIGPGGSTGPEILLDDPRGLPLVRLPLEVVEPHLLRLRVLHRKRLLVAEPLLPGPHQGGQARDLRLVPGLGAEVARLVGVVPQVEQLAVIDRWVDDELPAHVTHRTYQVAEREEDGLA